MHAAQTLRMGRRPGIKTEMQKWDERVAKWNVWATDRGMEVDFVWWGESELEDRLSQPEHAGRLAFWFGNPELFIDSWFKARLDEAVVSAGSRYSPELHVDLADRPENSELFGPHKRRGGFRAATRQADPSCLFLRNPSTFSRRSNGRLTVTQISR